MSQALTIAQVVDLIIQHTTGRPLDRTGDVIHHGDPDRPVTGIVTTFMPTVDVIRAAHARGANLLIPHEGMTHVGRDDPGGAPLHHNAVITAKRRLLDEAGITVWQCHDYLHRRVPDGILEGMVAAIGWAQYQDRDTPWFFRLPRTTVADVAAHLRAVLAPRAMRLVGDPSLPVAGVGLSPGCPYASRQIDMFNRPDLDCLVLGEAREWETVEYVRDAISLGWRKAAIVLGHRNSEEQGMAWFARWLGERLPGVPVTWIDSGDPLLGV